MENSKVCVICEGWAIVSDRSWLYVKATASELLERYGQAEMECTLQEFHNLPNIKEEFSHLEVAKVVDIQDMRPKRNFNINLKSN